MAYEHPKILMHPRVGRSPHPRTFTDRAGERVGSSSEAVGERPSARVSGQERKAHDNVTKFGMCGQSGDTKQMAQASGSLSSEQRMEA